MDAWFAKCLVREARLRFPDARAAYDAIALTLGPPARGTIATGAGPTSGPVQITPISRDSLGAADARTISLAASEEDVPLPVQRGSSGALIGGIAVAIVGLVAGVVFLLSKKDPETTTDPTIARTVALPACASGMVSVPQGSAKIGDDDGESDERPSHPVTLNGFCIDETEVTIAAYEACVKANWCTPLATKIDWPDAKESDHAFWDDFCNAQKTDRSTHPANCVTFEQAAQFCSFSHKRLPTEEEWEYAARSDQNFVFPWGNDPPSALRANVCALECATKWTMLDHPIVAMHPVSDNWEGTAPVKSFPAGKSALGAFDMAGNVSEWTQSRFCPYPGNNCSSENRTTRGGSFADEESRSIRASHRHKDAPNAKTPVIGFRCAK